MSHFDIILSLYRGRNKRGSCRRADFCRGFPCLVFPIRLVRLSRKRSAIVYKNVVLFGRECFYTVADVFSYFFIAERDFYL